jgi:hypothetical protein
MKAVLIAAAIGAGLFWAYNQAMPTCSTKATSGLMEGAIIGAGVQIGVRLLGVS